MEKINCTIERITFQNPENGYSVLQATVKGYREEQTIVGTFHEVTVGAVLIVEGNWRVDKRYGRQFAAESWSETLPATVIGIEKYLGSGLVKGIGPKFAKQIVSHFGLETFEVIENDIDRLLEVPGIGKGRVAKIKESWEKQKDVKDIMVFLQGHGVSSTYAAKIYKQYGKDSIQKVQDNPYCLADDIWGIGFKTADGIAEKLGYEKSDLRRCRSGILYTLSKLSEDGHVYSEREQLIKSAKELQADEEPITLALDEMIASEDLMLDEDAIFLPPFYYAEVGVANKLRRLIETPMGNIFDSSGAINEDVGKRDQIEYDEVQLSAIRKAIGSKVMVLTGGPGTGKTTTTLGIIASFETLGQRILLAAPTGRAAKRMSEATGKEAKTIHRLLEFNPAEGYGRNDENPLDGDVLIVDESSMIDVILMNSLLKAVPLSMRLILVGEIDQLPSVGAGNVLRDIIDSGVVPVIRLTRIFRQAQSSRIITLLMTHYVMLQRNLIYTGITRAKKICIIVGTTKALAYSIHNMVVLKRNTRLKERLHSGSA